VKILHEFRQFIQRGNVIDLAVGLIMGTAFTNIVKSLVTDVITPPIGYLIGGVKFTDLKITLPARTIAIPDPLHLGSTIEQQLEPATINYGEFLQASFSFLITAICIFMMIKGMNELNRRMSRGEIPPPAPPEPSPTEKLLVEIRDLLQRNQGTASQP
jgi:large conductance mechanosensitive channel